MSQRAVGETNHQAAVGDMPHCAFGEGGDRGDAPDAATALCAFFCGFFLAPAPMLVGADFERAAFADFIP